MLPLEEFMNVPDNLEQLATRAYRMCLVAVFSDLKMNTRVSAIFPITDGLLNGRTNRSS